MQTRRDPRSYRWKYRTGGRSLALLLGVACALLSLAVADEPADKARSFGRMLLSGEFKPDEQAMSPEMLAAMTAEQVEKIRSGLVAQHGALGEVGEARLEDTVGGYRRFRVPVTFEKATLDLRVVLAADDKIAGLFIVPHVDPPAAAEEKPPVKEVDVVVGEKARGLPGTLSLPEGAGPFPAIVLVHGSGPNDRDETIGPNKPFRDLAWGLAERGIVVLRYDKRSFARPADLAAAGDKLTVREEVIDDARSALDLLRSRHEVDRKRVHVLGHSLGGHLTPRIASEAPRPDGMIIMAGSTEPLPEKMLEQVRYIAGLDGEVSDEERAQIDALTADVGKLRAALDGKEAAMEGPVLGAPLGYYRDLEEHDPPAEAAGLELPALVLQGGRDYQVTEKDFAGWKVALEGKEFACLVSYPKLDHLFHEGSGPSGPNDYSVAAPVAARVLDDIAAWIKERRCARTD